MVPTRRQSLFLFDGDCAFCSSCARWLLRHLSTSATIVPWQSIDLDPLGVSADEADTSVIWIDRQGNSSAGPDAVAALLGSSDALWARTAGWTLRSPVVNGLARPVYRLIARNRHRMPGGTPQCALPHDQRPGEPVD